MRESRYLTIEDRRIIEKLYRKGMKQREIAEILEVNQSTISRELKKGMYSHTMKLLNTQQRYSCDKAQDVTNKRYRNKGREAKITCLDCECVEIIEKLIIEMKYSPYAALVVLSRNLGCKPFCLSTMYNYIYKGVFPRINYFHLLEKVSRKQRRKSEPKQNKRVYGKSIEIRPDTTNQIGHWEMDTVIGKQTGKDEAILTLTERITKYEIMQKLNDKSSVSVIDALDELSKKYDFKKTFKTITVDNGSEFSDSESMEHYKNRKRTSIYYAHAYASYERPHNERMNRMVRRFFPKGKSIKNVSQADCDKAAEWLNSYPRASLKGYSPNEIMDEFLSDKKS